MKNREISNSDDVIDSRDIIARIEELEELEQAVKDAQEEMDGALDDETPDKRDALEAAQEAFSDDDQAELKALRALAEEAEGSPDWRHGETLIRDSYFTDYIEELIKDCYEMPKEMNSGNWPWRHVTIDYEAAAEEAKVDYIEADFDGVTYLIRA